MKKKTVVAISGGIDSLYAAHKLIKSGHTVEGVHFLTGFESRNLRHNGPSVPDRIIRHCDCPPEISAAMAQIAAQLGIKIHIIDIEKKFRERITDYFIREYRSGKTPNPCLACNSVIKFGTVMDFAVSEGATTFATGHYAVTGRDKDGLIHLYKGIDPKKDQSYFLSFLNQDQLRTTAFPLGNELKEEIVEKALKAGLKTISTGESQDICFIEGNDYKKFLGMQEGFLAETGDIVTENGEKIGRHKGLHAYTVGQRRGVDCPGPYPYYVIRLETETNRLVVGPESSLKTLSCSVNGINWINPVTDAEINVITRIRYGHKGTESTLRQISATRAIVDFNEPVRAVTPGQGAVFYRNSEVLGGGWIE